MLRAVLPRAGPGQEWLLTGHTEAAPSSEGRARPLDEGEGEGAEDDVTADAVSDVSTADDAESEHDSDVAMSD